MRLALIAAVHLYWRLWPARWTRRCIFRESCSRHVHRVALQEGGVAAFAALLRRYRQCRPGYGRLQVGEDRTLLLADGSCVGQPEIAETVWAEVWA